jgi:FolB domain-containing protein
MYTLLIRDLRVQATHGLLELEKHSPQEFLINSEITCTLDENLARADIFDETLCYGKMRELIIKICTENSYGTLETLVYNIHNQLLTRSSSISSITTSLEKTQLLHDCRIGIRMTSVQK